MVSGVAPAVHECSVGGFMEFLGVIRCNISVTILVLRLDLNLDNRHAYVYIRLINLVI